MGWLDDLHNKTVYLYKASETDYYQGRLSQINHELKLNLKGETGECFEVNGTRYEYSGFLPRKLSLGTKIFEKHGSHAYYRSGKTIERTEDTSYKKDSGFSGYHEQAGWCASMSDLEKKLAKKGLRIGAKDEMRNMEYKPELPPIIDDNLIKDAIDRGAEMSGNEIEALKRGEDTTGGLITDMIKKESEQ